MALFALVIEYLAVTRVDGGGDQRVTLSSVPKTTTKIDFVPLHTWQSPAQVVNALSSEELLGIYECFDSSQLNSMTPDGESAEISIRQQWSFSERGLTRRRFGITQTYHHLVLNLWSVDGSSQQYTIELPAYCKEVSIDLFDDREN